MDIKVLGLKNRLTVEKTGEQYLDLTAPSFTFIPEQGVKALHYVLANEAGRIDKICDRYFGTGEYIDAICIVNNIFNPFSVQEGDILVIPNLKMFAELNNYDKSHLAKVQQGKRKRHKDVTHVETVSNV